MEWKRSWLIGSQPDCDLIVKQPTVSGYHCRLTSTRQGYSICDLGSTNGTFVNGKQLPRDVETPVSRSDRITLGQTTPLPWPNVNDAAPPPAPAPPGSNAPRTLAFRGGEMVLGRDADCDLVVDAPTVSGRHARLVRSGARIEIEDLGSTNGTFLNGFRVFNRASVLPGDRITFGAAGEPYTLAIDDPPPPTSEAPRLAEQGSYPLADPAPVSLILATEPSPGAASAQEETSRYLSDLVGESWFEQVLFLLGRSLSRELRPSKLWAMRLVTVIAPLPIAFAVAVANRFDPIRLEPETWSAFASRLTWSVGFALVLLPFLFGVVSFLPELVLERPSYLQARRLGLSRSAYLVAKLGGLLPLVFLQALFYYVVVWSELEMSAPFALALIIVTLTASSGLALALAVGAWPGGLAPPMVGLGVLCLAMFVAVPAMQQGEPLRSLARLGASLTPLRWGIEAILVMEADRRPTLRQEPPGERPDQAASGEPVPEPAPAVPLDMAEPVFHAATERMGPAADLLGLVTVFLAILATEYAILSLPIGIDPNACRAKSGLATAPSPA